MILERSLAPENINLPPGLTSAEHAEREQLRDVLSERFNRARGAAKITGYNNAFRRVQGLMRCDELFDVSKEPQSVRDAYGPTEFGQQALVARRLIEAGVPMIKVARAWWDTHSDNFESNRELVGELDHVFSTFVLDLEQRGLLDSTLIVTLSEFGRTPKINASVGRDHFANAWSCSLTGGRAKRGLCYGKTDPDGQTVVEGKIDAGQLAATILKAAGIDPEKEYHLGQRPIPLVNPGIKAVDDIIA
jgi:uncharacterized protein (DUF1501 family)